MASSRAVTLVCLVLAAVLVASPNVEAAIICGRVTNALAPCLPYLQGKVKVQPLECCNKIKGLNADAKTTQDRLATCRCIKAKAARTAGINYGLAGGLPGKCGVNVPFKIAPSIDCSNTPDRQAACGCFKAAAAGVSGINYGLAGSLPGKCGFSIPYKVAPATDCFKVK